MGCEPRASTFRLLSRVKCLRHLILPALVQAYLVPERMLRGGTRSETTAGVIRRR